MSTEHLRRHQPICHWHSGTSVPDCIFALPLHLSTLSWASLDLPRPVCSEIDEFSSGNPSQLTLLAKQICAPCAHAEGTSLRIKGSFELAYFPHLPTQVVSVTMNFKLTSLLVLAAASTSASAAYCCPSGWTLRSSSSFYFFCDKVTASCGYTPETGNLSINLGSPAWPCPTKARVC